MSRSNLEYGAIIDVDDDNDGDLVDKLLWICAHDRDKQI